MSIVDEFVSIDDVDKDLIGAAQASSRTGLCSIAESSELTEEDWEYINNSVLVDVSVSKFGKKVGFIYAGFGGLHGFEYIFDSGIIRPACFKVIRSD